MSTYADFLDVATLLYANPTVTDEASGRALRKLNQTYSLIQLIATEAVAEAASDIFGAAGSPRVEKKAISEDHRRKFNVAEVIENPFDDGGICWR